MSSICRLFAFPVTVAAAALACSSDAPTGPSATDPVALIGVIAIPGASVTSGTKSWVDSATKRFYETDVSNASVDIISANVDVVNTTNLSVVSRVNGFVGNATSGGGTATTNGSGPNSIAFAPGAKADGHCP